MIHIEISREEITAFCRRHHIRRLALFGSVLREDFTPDSDVDVLVEFEPGKTPGLLRLMQMQLELTATIGRKVDLNTAEDLSRHFRENVLKSARVVYE